VVRARGTRARRILPEGRDHGGALSDGVGDRGPTKFTREAAKLRVAPQTRLRRPIRLPYANGGGARVAGHGDRGSAIDRLSHKEIIY